MLGAEWDSALEVPKSALDGLTNKEMWIGQYAAFVPSMKVYVFKTRLFSSLRFLTWLLPTGDFLAMALYTTK